MAPDEDETTVNESYAVTIPASLRDDLDLEPGDRLRWSVDDDERLVADIVRERHGAFSDLEPIDVGETTDAVEETERVSYRID